MLGNVVAGTHILLPSDLRVTTEVISRWKLILHQVHQMMMHVLILAAYDLSGGVTLVNQTNACSVGDVIFPDCTAADQTNAVIYNFTIVEPEYGITSYIFHEPEQSLQGDTVVAGNRNRYRFLYRHIHILLRHFCRILIMQFLNLFVWSLGLSTPDFDFRCQCRILSTSVQRYDCEACVNHAMKMIFALMQLCQYPVKLVNGLI